jgi:hypothetical protein
MARWTAVEKQQTSLKRLVKALNETIAPGSHSALGEPCTTARAFRFVRSTPVKMS